MRKALIHQFFKELDRELKRPAEIILTGAAAGTLFGHLRPSLDVDFEIWLKGRKGGRERTHLGEAIERASAQTGIAANYSEDIGHWSMVSYLDYRKHTLPYKKLGRLEIKLIAPEYWTIGKVARFLELDNRDLIKVIKKKKLSAPGLARLWGRALRQSPLSLASGQFRDHVIYFFARSGKSAWGKGFDPASATHLFQKAAGIAEERKVL